MKKPPKVLQLIKLLSNTEIGLLKDKLEKGNKKRLLRLIEYLIKTDCLTLDKKVVYETLFEEKYSPDRGYLIRNESRLLSQQIEWLLAELDIKEQMKNHDSIFHFHLLEAFQKRKALDLFQKEYTVSHKQALKYKDFHSAYNITELNLIYFTRFENLKKKDLPYLEELNEIGLKYLSSYYLTAFRQHQINHLYIHDSLFTYSTEINPYERDVVVNFKPYETTYSDYLYLKAKSYIVSLEEQESILRQCLEIAKYHFSKNQLLFQEEVSFCIAALAKNRSLLTRFEEADHYYQKYFEICKENDSPQFLFVMSDYIANQINLNEIEKAIQLLTETMPNATGIPKAKLRWQCLSTACFAFEEDTEALAKSLSDEMELPNIRTKYFFRFYYAICALLEERGQDAYREMENLRHLTSAHRNDLNIHSIVNFFHRYFYNTIRYPKNIDSANHENNIRSLRRDIKEFSLSAPPELRSYLPLLWLKRKLESRD